MWVQGCVGTSLSNPKGKETGLQVESSTGWRVGSDERLRDGGSCFWLAEEREVNKLRTGA